MSRSSVQFGLFLFLLSLYYSKRETEIEAPRFQKPDHRAPTPAAAVVESLGEFIGRNKTPMQERPERYTSSGHLKKIAHCLQTQSDICSK